MFLVDGGLCLLSATVVLQDLNQDSYGLRAQAIRAFQVAFFTVKLNRKRQDVMVKRLNCDLL